MNTPRRLSSLSVSLRKRIVPWVAAAIALTTVGCAKYAALTELRPTYRQGAQTAASRYLVKLDGLSRRQPEIYLGSCLDAAAAAAREIRVNPGNRAAWEDYNYAVGRLIGVVREAKLKPWEAPIIAPGENGAWRFSFPPPTRAEWHPANYDLVPSDRYRFSGLYIAQRSVKTGIGAPVVATYTRDDMDRRDPFAQGKRTYYGVTTLIEFQGRNAKLSWSDPLSVENIRFEGHTLPLAADFTAPLAMALARENPAKMEILRFLRPQQFAETARLARLQPYDPAKIPIICVHGLMDSHATWVPLINALRADPFIRANYQFWFYTYPSGFPYPHSAAIMRKQLDAIGAAYPGHKKAVLIGHSMGGIISRTMLTDSGLNLWNVYFDEPPAETSLSATTRKTLTDALIFRPRQDVSRAIFIAAPHRGSDLASNWLGRIGASLVKAPLTLRKISEEVREYLTLDVAAVRLNRIPNSIDTLSPENPFVKKINTLPFTPGIPYHSIIGDRGKGGNKDRTKPVSSDGVVPYWSSHLPGARSELVVPSNHSAQRHPESIAEVRRILELHVREAGRK